MVQYYSVSASFTTMLSDLEQVTDEFASTVFSVPGVKNGSFDLDEETSTFDILLLIDAVDGLTLDSVTALSLGYMRQAFLAHHSFEYQLMGSTDALVMLGVTKMDEEQRKEFLEDITSGMSDEIEEL